MKKRYITVVYNTSYYIYKFRINLIKQLQEQGYSVVAISPVDEYVPKLQEHGIIHYPIRMSQYSINPFQNIFIILQIYKALKKYSPIVSLHYTIKPNIFGNIAAKLTKTPVINNVAGAGKAFSSNNILFTLAIKILYKFAFTSSYKVFFQNNDDMNEFLNNHLLSKKKAERIPGSGVDLKRFFPTTKNYSTQEVTFLFIGRLLKQKGIREFLEASYKIIKEYPHIKCLIAGEHENTNDYIDLATLKTYTEHNENISYLGPIDPDQIPCLIGAADCVVLPSYYREGVPRSLLEAAAMGKVIITTNNVGCKEVVDEGINGFKCETKNVHCLTESMKKIIQMSSSDRKKMGLRGRKKIENEYDENIVIKKYLVTINKLAKNGALQ